MVRVWVSRSEKFVDAKRIVGSHKSKDRQCNGQTKKDKMINSGLQKKLHRKLKIEQHESNLKLGLILQSGCTKYLNATNIFRK